MQVASSSSRLLPLSFPNIGSLTSVIPQPHEKDYYKRNINKRRKKQNSATFWACGRILANYKTSVSVVKLARLSLTAASTLTIHTKLLNSKQKFEQLLVPAPGFRLLGCASYINQTPAQPIGSKLQTNPTQRLFLRKQMQIPAGL